jgi:hypothetical protein
MVKKPSAAFDYPFLGYSTPEELFSERQGLGSD